MMMPPQQPPSPPDPGYLGSTILESFKKFGGEPGKPNWKLRELKRTPRPDLEAQGIVRKVGEPLKAMDINGEL